MGKFYKNILSSLFVLCLMASLTFSVFAATDKSDLLDDDVNIMWKNFNYVVGKEYAETGITCPKCGASIRKIDRWTCPSCGYNAMVVDSDGKTTFTAGGGKAGSGVGRPKAYKEDNTPAVLSTGEYTMYVHPTFIRKSTGLPFVNGTQNSKDSSTGAIVEDAFFTTTLEANRLSVSYSTPVSTYNFSINSNVYYYITAPVTGNYQFFDWKYEDVKCAGSFQALDKQLSVQTLNLPKGYTSKEVYFCVQSNAIFNGQFTYISVPDLMVKYTPFNEKTQDFQPLEKVPSITANNEEIIGTIYHDPINNYYYSYDDEDNCTVYVENKNGDIIGDITYNTTENTYVTNIYPGATTGEDESTPTPTPTPTPGDDTDDTPTIIKLLESIQLTLVNGFKGITEKLTNIGVGGSTPETAKPGSSGDKGQSWWDKLLSKIGDAIIDGLLGAVSAVLKLIFKLFSTILGWIIWLVSQVLTLFPFLPPGLGALLIGGVVVCFVIGIIKFIRG